MLKMVTGGTNHKRASIFVWF